VCHYSSTVRRYRGSSKEKARHLQEKLDNAERLLRNTGVIGQPVNPPSPPALQYCDRLGVLLQAANLSPETNHTLSYPAGGGFDASTSAQHQGPQTYGQAGEELSALGELVAPQNLDPIMVPAQPSGPDLSYFESDTIGADSSGRGVERPLSFRKSSSSSEHTCGFSAQEGRASLRSSTSSDATAVDTRSQDTNGCTEEQVITFLYPYTYMSFTDFSPEP
jgi:hypothetical protein